MLAARKSAVVSYYCLFVQIKGSRAQFIVYVSVRFTLYPEHVTIYMVISGGLTLQQHVIYGYMHECTDPRSQVAQAAKYFVAIIIYVSLWCGNLFHVTYNFIDF
jgi:hypothetical protein